MSDVSPIIKDLSVSLVNKLFQGEMRRLKAISDSLVRKNIALMGPQDGFVYGGKLFSIYKVAYSQATKKPLHESLSLELSQHLLDKQNIQMDAQKIRQNIVNLLTPCSHLQDIRDALPNCLVNLEDNLKNIDRIKEDGWSIKNDAMKYKQYLKVKPLIEFYSSTSLLHKTSL